MSSRVSHTTTDCHDAEHPLPAYSSLMDQLRCRCMRVVDVAVVQPHDRGSLSGSWRVWSAVLGYPIVEDIDGLARLRGPQTAGAPDLWFMRVDDPTPGKNGWHVDLAAHDVGAEITRLVGLGATVTARFVERDKTWTVLEDPEGNVFCLGAHST